MCGKKIAFRFRVKRLHPEDRVRVDERRVDGRSRDHSVVIIGITLHFGQALPAAGGAPLEVGTLHRPAIVLRDERLAHVGCHVCRAVTEVDDGLDVGLTRRLDGE